MTYLVPNTLSTLANKTSFLHAVYHVQHLILQTHRKDNKKNKIKIDEGTFLSLFYLY